MSEEEKKKRRKSKKVSMHSHLTHKQGAEAYKPSKSLLF